MQPVEAITLLIQDADKRIAHCEKLKQSPDFDTEDPEWHSALEQTKLAVNICQAMLNTALPVARFRAFVKIDSGKEEGLEYTICAVKIEEVVCALRPLTKATRKVYVSLWEQRATGADMLAGYQGWTRHIARRSSHNALGRYLDDLVSKYASS